MKNLSTFQLIVMGIFMFLALGALIVFSMTSLGGNGGGLSGDVVIWGALPKSGVEGAVADVARAFRGVNVSYEEKNPVTFDQELVAALAAGRGPDILVLPHTLIVRHADKIVPLPYESVPERTFRDTFVEAGELFLAPEGVIGIPWVIDPMVLYWNRDLLAGAGIARAPSFWEEVVASVEKLTTRGARGTITQSAVALGDADNIENAAAVMSLLLIQSGDPIVSRGADKRVSIDFGLASDESAILPADAALRFFTQFGNIDSRLYTWNRGFSSAIEAFAAGQVGLYLDRASAEPAIRQLNPHANFDVAVVPQIRGRRAATFGTTHALALVRASRNPQAAFSVLTALSGAESSARAVSELRLASARRDVLATGAAGDIALDVFGRSALITRGWLDPFPAASGEVLTEMISAVTGGRLREFEAISRARKQLELLFTVPF